MGSEEIALEFAESVNAAFVETSAKDDTGIRSLYNARDSAGFSALSRAVQANQPTANRAIPSGVVGHKSEHERRETPCRIHGAGAPQRALPTGADPISSGASKPTRDTGGGGAPGFDIARASL